MTMVPGGSCVAYVTFWRAKDGSICRDSGAVAQPTRPVKINLMKPNVTWRGLEAIRRFHRLTPKRAAVLVCGAFRSTPELALRDDGRRSFSFTLANGRFPLADRRHDGRRRRRRRHIGGEGLTAQRHAESRAHFYHRAGTHHDQRQGGCASNAENFFHHWWAPQSHLENWKGT